MRRSGVFRAGICAIAIALAVWLGLWAAASSSDAVWPEEGELVYVNGNLVVDASHSDQGYVMIRCAAPTGKRLKVRIALGQATMTYDVNGQGDYEVYPLQMGSGSYEISMFENVSGTKFSSAGKVSFYAQLTTEDAAYLVTNQYVSYMMNSVTVAKSDELSAGKNKQEIYDTITAFMGSDFTYDFVRAVNITAGTLPEVDPCFEKRMGICQDLSAVMVCMLRVQGIPAKLCIGYADKYYHAWTVAVVDGKEIFFDPTEAVGAISASSYSVERMY